MPLLSATGEPTVASIACCSESSALALLHLWARWRQLSEVLGFRPAYRPILLFDIHCYDVQFGILHTWDCHRPSCDSGGRVRQARRWRVHHLLFGFNCITAWGLEGHFYLFAKLLGFECTHWATHPKGLGDETAFSRGDKRTTGRVAKRKMP